MVKERDYEFLSEKVIVLYDKLFPLYIIRGEKNFLVDAGADAGAPKVYERIREILMNLASGGAAHPANKPLHGASDNSGTSAVPKIDTLLLTHTHWDHTGGMFYLQEKFGFNVICSRRAEKLLQKQNVLEIIEFMNLQYKMTIKDSSPSRFDSLQNLETVEDGDTIRVDADSYLQVLETPGHTRCSLSFLLLPENILFPADAVGLIARNGSIWPLFFSDYPQYEQSIERLIGLQAEVLAFAHNKFIKGKEKVKTHLENCLSRTRKVKDIILKLLQKNPDPDVITNILHEREFTDSPFIGSQESLKANLKAMVKIASRL